MKPETQTITNADRDSFSQSSLYNLLNYKQVTIPLFIDLWTPIYYKIKPNFMISGEKIEIPPNHIKAIPSEME